MDSPMTLFRIYVSAEKGILRWRGNELTVISDDSNLPYFSSRLYDISLQWTLEELEQEKVEDGEQPE